jgi:hypothetical protein
VAVTLLDQMPYGMECLSLCPVFGSAGPQSGSSVGPLRRLELSRMEITTTPDAGVHEERQTKSIVRTIPMIARILLGLLFMVTGLNGLLNFLPQPTAAMPEGAAALMGGFMKSGYMLPLIYGDRRHLPGCRGSENTGPARPRFPSANDRQGPRASRAVRPGAR